MTTRIYQGRIVQAHFEDENLPQDKGSALAALERTNRLFQDAVNYHLVALAGMAEDGKETLGSRFKKQVRAIWEDLPRGKAGACTLQRSIARTLCLPENVGFDAAVAHIFEGCDRLDVLPYVEHYIIEQTQRGEGAIQQQGRELLPKLCNPFFEGNFDYSIKERKANFGKQKLQRELNRDDITDEEIYTLAQEMDLSWVVKTLPNVNHDAPLYYEPEAQKEKISTSMQKLLASVVGGKLRITTIPKYVQSVDFREKIQQELLIRKPLKGARLAKSSRGISVDVEQAGIYFMFYPGRVSAALLASKLGKEKVNNERAEVEFDLSAMDNDPLILARGKRGYVYKGFTALPNWAVSDNRMFSREWDILAFKEALKTLHGFELKTKERMKIREDFNVQREALEKGTKIKFSGGDDIDEEKPVVALEGDYRFDLMKQLVRELSPDLKTEYHITSRTLNDYELVREKWLKRESEGTCTRQDLEQIVREHQAKSKHFGSQLLYEALCREEYRPIWHDDQSLEKDKLPRSKNILRDFSEWQYLNEQIIKYSRDVRVTAADTVASPRQMIYSDISNFGDGKGCELIGGCNGGARLRVVIRNAKGGWETTSIRVTFSAPRFVRDEMSSDTGNWNVAEKGENTSLPWLQPMMKALGEDIKPVRLQRTPAVGLQVHGQGCEAHFYLNFPVTLDVEELQQSIGKAAIWKGQFHGTTEEKLHLHWPSTYKGSKLPWWELEGCRKQGYDVLGVDLGLRSASAWSLVHVDTVSEFENSRGVKVQGRWLGDGTHDKWYGHIVRQGLCRLAGEAPRKVGMTKVPSVSLASFEDMVNARFVYQNAGYSFTAGEATDVLQLGNRTLKVFGRLLSRLKMYLAFMSGMKDSARKDKVWTRMVEYFNHAEMIPGMRDAVNARAEEKVYSMLAESVKILRDNMPEVAENVTTLILPRKRGVWNWCPETREGWQGAGVMKLFDKQGKSKRPVYHRGGLSVDRLTQLENLRQRLQSMSKVLSIIPGEPVPFGREMEGKLIIDPCPDILVKIENMREQRVNQIAHDIVALALGVRLVPSRDGKNADGQDVIHGEYERIPGRVPVDFVVMENLSRYLTSIDRSRDENMSLMRWAHRQIAAKVKQLLEEVFGIPVVFTHAHYTSRFDSKTSEPGFRPELMKLSHLEWLLETGNEKEKEMARAYYDAWKKVLANNKQQQVTLLQPHRDNGGEYFLSRKNGKFTLRHADMNAATNIVWHGLASPDALDLLHRVRLEKKKSGVVPVYGNIREKTRKQRWDLRPNPEAKLEDGKHSAFVVSSLWKDKAFATYGDAVNRHTLCLGIDMWSVIKSSQRLWCHLYNIEQLRNAGVDARNIESLIGFEDADEDVLPYDN